VAAVAPLARAAEAALADTDHLLLESSRAEALWQNPDFQFHWEHRILLLLVLVVLEVQPLGPLEATGTVLSLEVYRLAAAVVVAAEKLLVGLEDLVEEEETAQVDLEHLVRDIVVEIKLVLVEATIQQHGGLQVEVVQVGQPQTEASVVVEQLVLVALEPLHR
jgi:hypothetical protein